MDDKDERAALEDERAALAERVNRQILREAEERERTSRFKAQMFLMVVVVGFFVIYLMTR